MHIYYEQNFFRSNTKEELIGFTEFLSNTGGLLGLFLGFSVVSLIEIFYFLTLRPYCNQKQQNDKDSGLKKSRRRPLRKRDKAVEIEGNIRRNKFFGKIKSKELALFRPEIFEPNDKSFSNNRYQYFEWIRNSEFSFIFLLLSALSEAMYCQQSRLFPLIDWEYSDKL